MTLFKFKTPFNKHEERQRFFIVEDRGEVVCVQCTGLFEQWLFKPTFVYKKSELEEVKE